MNSISSLSAPNYPAAVQIDPPETVVGGTVCLPGSKSITNRALLIAGLARGESALMNALYCDDSRYLSEALHKLGVEIREDRQSSHFTVEGAGGPFRVREGNFFLGNAGTATRFLTAALAFTGGTFGVDGDVRMRQRPIGELVRALGEMGAVIHAPSGCPPVEIKPWSRVNNKIGPALEGGSVTMAGRTSSQFISALLLSAPLTRSGIQILVDGECVSRPYVDVTIAVMRSFGARVWADDGRDDGRTAFCVRSGRGYQGRSYWIEGDASTASYFLAAAAIRGGTVRVEGIGKESIQGDARFADVLARMGAHVKKASDEITLTGGELHGITENCSDIPDVVPTLAAVALMARGRTRITGASHLRFKESDRIASVGAEFRKLGGCVKELPDGLEIQGGGLHAGEVNPWGDHRLAMAAALVGLRVPGVIIQNPGVVAKSFPEYFDVMRGLGARVRPLGEGHGT